MIYLFENYGELDSIYHEVFYYFINLYESFPEKLFKMISSHLLSKLDLNSLFYQIDIDCNKPCSNVKKKWNEICSSNCKDFIYLLDDIDVLLPDVDYCWIVNKFDIFLNSLLDIAFFLKFSDNIKEVDRIFDYFSKVKENCCSKFSKYVGKRDWLGDEEE